MVFKNEFNVPLPLALWLSVDTYDPSKYINEISATTLIKSPRYIMAQLRTKYPDQFSEHLRPIQVSDDLLEPIDIQTMIASRVGTAIHSGVESAWKNNYKEGLALLGYPQSQIDKVRINPTEHNPDYINIYLEDRLYKTLEIDGISFVISGQYDIIINGKLNDIKTTSTYSYENGCNDLKYIKQGSIYRWLNPELITNDHLTINFLFLDYKNYMDNRNSNYPPAKAYFKEYKLMSLHDTEAMIRNKLKLIVKHWNDPLEQIPCCTITDLFTGSPKYKYYKNGVANSTRSTKNFDTFAEASAYRAKQGHIGDIVEDRGNPFKCPYCIDEEIHQMMNQVHIPTKLEIG